MKDQTLKICGQDVELKFVNSGDWDNITMGQTAIKEGKILIANKMPVTVQDSTMIHEIMHYILQSNYMERSDNLDTEIFVSTVSCCLHAFLRDNKELVKEICER